MEAVQRGGRSLRCGSILEGYVGANLKHNSVSDAILEKQ